MNDHEAVDFVVTSDETSDDPHDEELAQPPRWPLRALWALGVAAVVAIAAVVLVHRGDPAPVAAPSASRAVGTPTPDIVSTLQPVRVPEGNRSARPLPVCPSGAECYSDTLVPSATMTVLRKQFPSAQLTWATEVLANRTGRFGPDLVARLVHARAGSVDITVTVGKPGRGDEDGYHYDRSGPLLHSRATYVGSAFTVIVEIVQLGAKHRPSRAALDRIARDARLVVPQ